MAKPEWGIKRTCLNCAVRFYDLGKKPITCPACESTFEPEAFVKTRRSRQSAPSEPKKPAPAPAPAPAAEKPETKEPEAEAADDDAGEDDDTVLPAAGDAEDESEDVAELVDTPGKTKSES